MSGTKRPGKQPYQYSGMYTIRKALEAVKNQEEWLNHQGTFGEALKKIREDLIATQGGADKITPAELMTIEGMTFCHMLMMSTGRFIGEQESPVNRSRRQLFPVVTQWLTLFREVRDTAKDLNLLREKRPKAEPVSLTNYLDTTRTSHAKAPGKAPVPSTATDPTLPQR